MRAAARSPEQDAVRLELDVEAEPPGVGQQVEEVFSQQQLAAAENQEERAGCRELIEHATGLRPWSSRRDRRDPGSSARSARCTGT